MADFWTWPGWTAVNSIATIAAAGVVLKYTHETIKLRRIAQEELEASIAPLLVLTIEKPKPEEHAMVLESKQEGGETVSFTIRNQGKGAALRTVFHGAVLPPIAAGQTLHCRMEVMQAFGGTRRADGFWPDSDHELVYLSTSGQKYQTRCRSRQDKISAESLKYLRLDE